MAITILDADQYIANYCIDIDDWQDSEESRKQRLLNVAERGLRFKYPQYTIPNEAIYEYTNELAIGYNDVNKMQQQGVASYAVTGVASFTFKDWAKSGLDALIPQTALQIIGDANGVKIGGRRAAWGVL